MQRRSRRLSGLPPKISLNAADAFNNTLSPINSIKKSSTAKSAKKVHNQIVSPISRTTRQPLTDISDIENIPPNARIKRRTRPKASRHTKTPKTDVKSVKKSLKRLQKDTNTPTFSNSPNTSAAGASNGTKTPTDTHAVGTKEAGEKTKSRSKQLKSASKARTRAARRRIADAVNADIETLTPGASVKSNSYLKFPTDEETDAVTAGVSQTQDNEDNANQENDEYRERSGSEILRFPRPSKRERNFENFGDNDATVLGWILVLFMVYLGASWEAVLSNEISSDDSAASRLFGSFEYVVMMSAFVSLRLIFVTQKWCQNFVDKHGHSYRNKTLLLAANIPDSTETIERAHMMIHALHGLFGLFSLLFVAASVRVCNEQGQDMKRFFDSLDNNLEKQSSFGINHDVWFKISENCSNILSANAAVLIGYYLGHWGGLLVMLVSHGEDVLPAKHVIWAREVLVGFMMLAYAWYRVAMFDVVFWMCLKSLFMAMAVTQRRRIASFNWYLIDFGFTCMVMHLPAWLSVVLMVA